jgi:hypothetical protein
VWLSPGCQQSLEFAVLGLLSRCPQDSSKLSDFIMGHCLIVVVLEQIMHEVRRFSPFAYLNAPVDPFDCPFEVLLASFPYQGGHQGHQWIVDETEETTHPHRGGEFESRKYVKTHR